MTRRITPTYTLINQVTLAAASPTVTFSNIPQNFADLVLVVNGAAQAIDNIWIRLNGDSGSNYTFAVMYGAGSSAISGQGTMTYAIGHYNNTTSRFFAQFQIMDSSAIDKHKTILTRGGQADGYVTAYANRWASTAAVNSILCGTVGVNYLTGTTFSLYGVVA